MFSFDNFADFDMLCQQQQTNKQMKKNSRHSCGGFHDI